MVRKKVLVTNKSGLHARPANVFVKQAGRAKSEVTIEYDGQTYNGKSILSVLSACIHSGTEMELVVCGEDEQETLSALVEAVEAGLGEGEG